MTIASKFVSVVRETWQHQGISVGEDEAAALDDQAMMASETKNLVDL